MQIISDIKQRS